MLRDLDPEETELHGAWVANASGMQPDEICERIHWLVSSRLERIGTDTTGWETLYRDLRDGRLWEHHYPQGEMHGGGPPALRLIAPASAAAKYRVRTV